MLSRTVAKRFDGTWTNKVTGTTKATTIHKSMDEAIASARGMLAKAGGGELRLRINYNNTVEMVEPLMGTAPSK